MSAVPSDRSARPGRPRVRVSRGLILATVILGFAGAELVLVLQGWSGRPFVGVDREHYLAAAQRWLDTGTPYLASEVAGPFSYQDLTFLHPPSALLLMVPFLPLPAPLWWIVPIGIVLVSIRRWRPATWSWPILALLLAWPRSIGVILVGNTDLWVAAFVALGLTYGWPAILIAIKPSFAPLALLGVLRRSWWVAAPIALLAALPFGSLWVDWFDVLRNAPATWTYSILNLPLVVLPIVAWAARRSRPAAGADRGSASVIGVGA